MAGGLLDPLGGKRVKFQGLLGDKYDPNSALDAAPQGLLGPLGLFAMKNAPSFAGSAYDAVTAPGRAMKGELPLYGIDENGNRVIHPEAMDSIMNLAGMLTLGSGAIPAQANELRMGIKAYHGSPHDFDKFDMSKIGTGEGAQAYGHGLYFAENEGVAKSYRDANQTYKTFVNGVSVEPKHPQFSPIMSIAANGYDNALKQAQEFAAAGFIKPEEVDAIKALKGFKIEQKPSGSMYEVDINADPNAFLDWDKPLSEQTKNVKQALKYEKENTYKAGATYGTIAQRLGGEDLASEYLKRQGIPGIKYLDAGSRFNPANLPDNPIANEARQFLSSANGDADKALQMFRDSNPIDRWATTERDEITKVIKSAAVPATRNYVVFDDKLITILRKYGWVPGMAIPAAAMQEYNGKEPDL